jgi:hypothetical protein
VQSRPVYLEFFFRAGTRSEVRLLVRPIMTRKDGANDEDWRLHSDAEIGTVRRHECWRL